MKKGTIARMFIVAAAILAVLLAASSCGSGEAKQPASTTTKLPPGMAGSENAAYEEVPSPNLNASEEQGDAPAAGSETSSGAAEGSGIEASTAKTVTLSGVEFTVMAAKREGDNKLVASSGTREVKGDFLEVELKIKNMGDTLVELSRFSFRLWNPYIDAASYDDYYGNVTTYGGYVSTNIISASLLDYATLRQVSTTLKMGEEIGDVFLFFDLNPLSVSRNQGFTKEGSNLVIYDTWTGKKTEVNLAGFPD